MLAAALSTWSGKRAQMPFLDKMATHLKNALSLKDNNNHNHHQSNKSYFDGSATATSTYNKRHCSNGSVAKSSSSQLEHSYYNTDYFASSKQQQQQREKQTVYRNGECNDADWLYFQSKEKFACWDIRDLVDHPLNGQRTRSIPKKLQIGDDPPILPLFIDNDGKDETNPDIPSQIDEISVKNNVKRSSPRRDIYSSDHSSDEEYYENFFRRKNEQNSRAVDDTVLRRAQEDVDQLQTIRPKESGNRKHANSSHHVQEMRSEKVIQVEEYKSSDGKRYSRMSPDENENRDNVKVHRRSYAGKEESRERNGRNNSSLRDRRRNDENVARVDKISQRHSRPLTPPEMTREESIMSKSDNRQLSFVMKSEEVRRGAKSNNNNNNYKSKEKRLVMNEIDENIVKSDNATSVSKRREDFSIEDWCEANRQFAANYLKEHSKVNELYTNKTCDELVEKRKSSDLAVDNTTTSNKSLAKPNEKSVTIYRVGSDGKKRVVEVKKNTREINQRNVYQLESDEEALQVQREKDTKKTKSIEESDLVPTTTTTTTTTINEKKSLKEKETSRERSFVTPSRKRWNYSDQVKSADLNMKLKYYANLWYSGALLVPIDANTDSILLPYLPRDMSRHFKWHQYEQQQSKRQQAKNKHVYALAAPLINSISLISILSRKHSAFLSPLYNSSTFHINRHRRAHLDTTAASPTLSREK
uniref:Uncharacterized protein n=1 Tax=Trichogramma kaykai TaxID=54128 RepID=A0ABD2WVV9_9HYME